MTIDKIIHKTLIEFAKNYHNADNDRQKANTDLHAQEFIQLTSPQQQTYYWTRYETAKRWLLE